jgi:hypothetical protein
MEIIKKYNCRYCIKSFSSTKSRWNHEKLIHKNGKNGCCDTVSDSLMECEYCKKLFVNKYSLERHLKNNCKDKKHVIQKIETNNTITVNSNNNINSNNLTQNNNYNIIINPINNPNTDNFTLMDICDIFDEQFNTILTIIEKIYFNDKIKENHSFYVSNLNGEYVKTLDSENNENTKIKKYLFDEVFTLMIDKIKSLYFKYKKKLFEVTKQKEIQEKIKALESMQNERLPTYKSYLKLINVLAYNKKDIVINTWDKMKNNKQQIKDIQLENMEIIWDTEI